MSRPLSLLFGILLVVGTALFFGRDKRKNRFSLRPMVQFLMNKRWSRMLVRMVARKKWLRRLPI